MRFGILGSLVVWSAGGTPVKVPEAKVRALLAYLLAHRGETVSADRLIDGLWGDRLPARPVAVLQTKASQLRRALDAAVPGGRGLVESGPSGYALRVGADDVDAGRFTGLVDRAHRAESAEARAALLREALALWRGPAFAEFADEEFVRAAATRLAETRATAYERLAEARLALGEQALLADELGDRVAQYPGRERLRATYMRALHLAGRQSEALATYGEFRAWLAEELGVDPSPELASLYRALLRQDAVLVGTAGGDGAVASGRPSREEQAGNLPAILPELLGRDDLLADVRALVGVRRLVTLTGPGGVGKTRLALEAASGLAGAFPDGRWLVELAGIEHTPGARSSARAGDVAEVVAAALGVRDDMAAESGAAQDSVARLVEVLRGRKMLLVFDNCEHVVDAAAELVGRLLASAPELTVLATGQEPLELAGEVLVAVPPLALPRAGADPDEAQQAAAVRLFAARAGAATAGFVVDESNADAVAAICRRLDGIPLALELAATRVRSLGVAELAARLDDRFRVLTAGRRDAPARQQTLRAMIDWSWGLLGEQERVVLRRLAVQADGCTPTAAELVCGGASVGGPLFDRTNTVVSDPGGSGPRGSAGVADIDVLDALTRLVDRSLVVLLDTDPATGPRYRVLESIAAYGIERLREAGEFDLVKERHRHYYAALAEEASLHLGGGGQQQWLRRLDAENANLRNALESAARAEDSATALRLVNGAAWYWVLRGRLAEGRKSLRLALALPGDGAPPDDAATDAGTADLATARATAQDWLVGLSHWVAESPGPAPDMHTHAFPPASDATQGSGKAAAERSALARRARAAWFRAFAGADFGDPATTLARTRGVLDVFEALGDRWGVAASRLTLAELAAVRSELVDTVAHGTAALEGFRDLGDGWGMLQASSILSIPAEASGDYAEAARLRRDALRLAEQLGLATEVALMTSALGRVALVEGDYATADDLHTRAMRLAAEQSNTRAEEAAELGLALAARRTGRLDDAERHLLRWLDWNRRIDSDLGTALFLAELGFVAEQRGDAEAALAHHHEGLVSARSIGDPRAIALAWEGLAGAYALVGDHALAARLLGAAAQARESVGAPLPSAERGDVDRITAAVRRALGDAGFTARFEEGRVRPPELPVRRNAVRTMRTR